MGVDCRSLWHKHSRTPRKGVFTVPLHGGQTSSTVNTIRGCYSGRDQVRGSRPSTPGEVLEGDLLLHGEIEHLGIPLDCEQF